jgi:hypothetical protein
MEVLASWTCKQLAVVVFDVAGTGAEVRVRLLLSFGFALSACLLM